MITPVRTFLALALSVLAMVVVPASASAYSVLITENFGEYGAGVKSSIEAVEGVSSVQLFFTGESTPTAEQLAGYDVVVSIGDSSYSDAQLWGNRLADYVDAGGIVIQTAYDNWEDDNSSPTGRFAEGGYTPLLNGNNDNSETTLGELVDPDHPLLQGLGTFSTELNTNTPLAPGATLLAKWADGRNAIALKGRVVATSSAPYEASALSAIAQLVDNAVKFFPQNVSVTKAGTGSGTVTGTRNGVACGELCAGPAGFGTQFSFVATPAANSRFVGWTGACTGVGACALSVAGRTPGIGAIFDLASFGDATLVTIKPVSSKVPKSGKLKIRFRSTNDFSLTGSLSGKVGKSKVKAKSFSVGASGSRTVTLTLSKSLRSKLAKKRKLKIALTANLKDPAGRTRTLKKSVTIKKK